MNMICVLLEYNQFGGPARGRFADIAIPKGRTTFGHMQTEEMLGVCVHESDVP